MGLCCGANALRLINVDKALASFAEVFGSLFRERLSIESLDLGSGRLAVRDRNQDTATACRASPWPIPRRSDWAQRVRTPLQPKNRNEYSGACNEEHPMVTTRGSTPQLVDVR